MGVNFKGPLVDIRIWLGVSTGAAFLQHNCLDLRSFDCVMACKYRHMFTVFQWKIELNYVSVCVVVYMSAEL